MSDEDHLEAAGAVAHTGSVTKLVLRRDSRDPACVRLTLRGADHLALASIAVNIAALKAAVDDLAAGNDP
jgi:hypothetical protein